MTDRRDDRAAISGIKNRDVKDRQQGRQLLESFGWLEKRVYFSEREIGNLRNRIEELELHDQGIRGNDFVQSEKYKETNQDIRYNKQIMTISGKTYYECKDRCNNKTDRTINKSFPYEINSGKSVHIETKQEEMLQEWENFLKLMKSKSNKKRRKEINSVLRIKFKDSYEQKI